MVVKLVLVRHGQTVLNKEKRFSGWVDTDLTERGVSEAQESAELLMNESFSFDTAFTSLMVRATHTLNIILRTMRLDIPVEQSWRLNERHYGALEGKSKPETAREVGEEQVFIWRRSWDVPPPPLTVDDERYIEQRKVYADAEEQPLSESLKDCVARTLPYWYDTILPAMKEGKNVLVVASGNSLRALVKMLDNISDQDISQLDIPTGAPLIYELDETNNFRPTRHYYLGNQEYIARRIQEIKDQAKE